MAVKEYEKLGSRGGEKRRELDPGCSRETRMLVLALPHSSPIRAESQR